MKSGQMKLRVMQHLAKIECLTASTKALDSCLLQVDFFRRLSSHCAGSIGELERRVALTGGQLMCCIRVPVLVGVPHGSSKV